MSSKRRPVRPAGATTVSSVERTDPVKGTRAVTLRIPHPPMAARPNGRSHWAEKARVVKAMRGTARLLGKMAWLTETTPMLKARAGILWRAKSHMAPDPYNIVASFKGTWDGLQDAGVIVNDRHLSCEPPQVELHTGKAEIIITITEELE